MKQRGRKSAAALAAEAAGVKVIDGGFGGKRPEPPKEMSERAGEIWRGVVAGEPADYFGTAALRGMLSDYCRHREVSDEMTDPMNAFEPDWLKEPAGMRRYEWLAKMRERETRAAASLATKLRITNQSRYRPRGDVGKTDAAPTTRAPWD